MLPGQDYTAADIGTCKSRSADWSRPIDTVDHEILLQRLQTELEWKERR